MEGELRRYEDGVVGVEEGGGLSRLRVGGKGCSWDVISCEPRPESGAWVVLVKSKWASRAFAVSRFQWRGRR